MSLFPGKKFFSPPKPRDPEPLPAPVTKEDPGVDKVRKDFLLAEKRRKGRKASILTSAAGDTDNLGIVKQATAGNGAKILG